MFAGRRVDPEFIPISIISAMNEIEGCLVKRVFEYRHVVDLKTIRHPICVGMDRDHFDGF